MAQPPIAANRPAIIKTSQFGSTSGGRGPESDAGFTTQTHLAFEVIYVTAGQLGPRDHDVMRSSRSGLSSITCFLAAGWLQHPAMPAFRHCRRPPRRLADLTVPVFRDGRLLQNYSCRSSAQVL